MNVNQFKIESIKTVNLFALVVLQVIIYKTHFFSPFHVLLLDTLQK